MRLLPVTAVLFVAGAAYSAEPTPEAVRKAVAKAIPRLWDGIDGHTEARGCFTCHNHAVPLTALAVARGKGFDIDAKRLAGQAEFGLKHYEDMRERMEKGSGPGGAVTGGASAGGGVDNTGYAAFAFAALGVKRNKTTDLLAEYTLAANGGAGPWPSRANRPPTEASSFATTYFALHTLREYGKPADAKKIDARIAAVREWLLKTPAKDTEDRAFRLLGLWLAGGTTKELEPIRKELLDKQAAAGGFAQAEKMEPDAYATGSALYALHRSGTLKATDPAYRTGLAFLLATQKDDGSWHVKTRSRPVQKYFESGFPHEKDQFISCAATGWATAALALSLPAK